VTNSIMAFLPSHFHQSFSFCFRLISIPVASSNYAVYMANGTRVASQIVARSQAAQSGSPPFSIVFTAVVEPIISNVYTIQPAKADPTYNGNI
jgi:hypothetical protein